MGDGDSDVATRWPPTFDRGAWAAVALVVAFAAWVVVSNTVLVRLLGPDPAVLSERALGVVSSTVQIAIAVAFLRYEGVRLRDVGLSKRLVVPAVVAVLGVVVAANAAVATLVVAGGQGVRVEPFVLLSALPREYSAGEVAVTAVYYWLFVGVAEELAFRGYLQNKLTALLDGWGDPLRTALAVVTAAVAFSLLHAPTILLVDRASLGGLVGGLLVTGLSGVAFGAIYVLTRNLLLVALLHGIGDFWPLFVEPAGSWPNWVLLVVLYAVLVVAYRGWAERTPRPTPGVGAD
ncbi:CPBP family intramembrane glutamic endopeptidase [Halorarius halobius]|uniref:CPBP family intramembrane glutamic endopeptidase n=1 Tax=Halorarius halobius TaxID=2962671 RepID=UPI0020CC6391|nr:CPBP family intramembrane glutamic endopeptidase [Halorarius halobius]